MTSGSGPSPQLSFDKTTNRINSSGYAYDAAGNMTSDGFHIYTCDAEGNLTQIDGGSTAAFTYGNQRVRRDIPGQPSNEYIFNAFGQHASVWDATDGWASREQAYWGSTPVELNNGGAAHYQQQDWLGTERMVTGYTGSVEGTYTSLPFGDGFQVTGSDPDQYHFAGLDYEYKVGTNGGALARFRMYYNTAGRWMSPDLYNGSYDFTNPQSFDRYSYTSNNPLSFTDPSGQVFGISAAAAGAACAANPVVCAATAIVAGIFDWKIFSSLFGGHQPVFYGSLKPRANAQPWDEHHIHWWNGANLASAFGLPDAGCEFGACVNVIFDATKGQTSTIGPTTGAISISGVWVLLGVPLIAGVGPAANVTWVPTKKMLCGGIGVGAAAGHTVSGGPEVVHARQGHTVKDVVSSWSVGGGYNWLPWLGGQGSANTSGSAAGWSFGIPGGSGSATWSWCHVFAGGSE